MQVAREEMRLKETLARMTAESGNKSATTQLSHRTNKVLRNLMNVLQTSWVRNHPLFHAHIHNWLCFHTTSSKLHDFVSQESLHMSNRNVVFLSINKNVNKLQICTVTAGMSWA